MGSSISLTQLRRLVGFAWPADVADTWRGLYCRHLLQRGRYKRVVKILSRLSRKSRGERRSIYLCWLGCTYLREGEYSASAEAYDAALIDMPVGASGGRVFLLGMSGVSKLATGQFDEAVLRFEEAEGLLSVESRSIVWSRWRAYALEMVGRHRTAMELCRELAKIDQGDSLWYYRAAVNALFLPEDGITNDAIVDAERAHEIGRGLWYVEIVLIVLKSRAGLTDAMRTVISQYEQHYPDDIIQRVYPILESLKLYGQVNADSLKVLLLSIDQVRHQIQNSRGCQTLSYFVRIGKGII